MCDSSRPATRMSAQLDRTFLVRGCTRMGVAALALAAVATVPGVAAAKTRPAAAHGHAAVTAHSAAHTPHAVAVAAGAGRKHGAAARAVPAADTPRHAGTLHGGSRTISSRAAAHPRELVLSTAHGRGKDRHSPSRAETQERYTPLSEASARTAAPLHARHQAGGHAESLRAARETAPAVRAETPAERAERTAEDRVHAWYRAQATSAAATPLPAATADPLGNAVKAAVLGSPAPVAASPKLAAKAEAPAPVKAPPADISRTAPAVPDAIHATSSAAPRSTADDDAAFAEASNIPSTAPTAREPLPFVHGDFPGAGLPTGAAPQHAAVAAKPKPPAVVRIDPRGDAEVLASATSGSAMRSGVKDVAAPLGQKPAALSTLSAPAANAVTAAARKPKLDPAIANGMAAGALDDDDSYGATPAATQAVRAAKAELPAARPAVLSGYDVELSGGPATQVKLFDDGGRLILLPPMKGSHEILVHQNQMAISDGLDRVENDGQLAEMHRLKLLVALPDTDAIFPNDRLPMNRRYARPWVVRFLNDMAQAHNQRFHTPLIVTSAVRTVAFQRHLVMVNGNAAPPTGDVASPHLYGQAVDLAKHGMTVAEIAWMRSYLTPVETAGKIDVEEEFQQSCFHISVYRRYLGLPTPHNAPDPAPQRTLQLAHASQPAPALHPFQRAKTALQRHRRLPTALLASGLR